MEQATVTSKGQITIPKKIREKLDLKAGDKVNFEITKQGHIEIRQLDQSIMDRAGNLKNHAKNKPVSIEEMNEAIKKAAVERYKRSL